MLAERLGVLDFRPGAVAVIADGRFKHNASAGIDCVTRTGKNRVRHTPVRIESCAPRPPLRYGVSSVAPDEEPFPGLPLELNDVKDILIGTGVVRCEVAGFRLH